MIKEPDSTVRDYQKKMYLLLGLDYSASALRIPKILLMLDDMSGTSLFTNSVENEFYKFVV